MNENYTRTYIVESENNNRIDISVKYDIGGYSYSYYREIERGYYFSITPYFTNGLCKTYHAFSGGRCLMVPCKRKNKKDFEKAISMIEEYTDMYLQEILDENNINMPYDTYTESRD